MRLVRYLMHRITGQVHPPASAMTGDEWIVLMVPGCGGVPTCIGYISTFLEYRSLRNGVDNPLAQVALPMFLSHAAYSSKLGNPPQRNNLEVIVSQIEEVPGLCGLYASGWPPRDDV